MFLVPDCRNILTGIADIPEICRKQRKRSIFGKIGTYFCNSDIARWEIPDFFGVSNMHNIFVIFLPTLNEIIFPGRTTTTVTPLTTNSPLALTQLLQASVQWKMA